MGVVGLECGSLVHSDRQLGHNGYLLVTAEYSLLISWAQKAENS